MKTFAASLPAGMVTTIQFILAIKQKISETSQKINKFLITTNIRKTADTAIHIDSP
ncbi:hypothetical protein [Snodgrassella alvi]|uniref:hypothetical protein n=1 Tax=Snodgrassella alvi TaxID=1196083 RepID=UPI0015D56C92|nr:hypothetical protein [Snodgrassella alvi]WLT04376.1 hypothetical protein RAM23_00285 [Snodgrassella alvi]